MGNTTTGQCLASLTASRRALLARTRLRVAAASFRRLLIRRTRRFRSTTARDRTSSRRICASRRHLVSESRLEPRPRDGGKAVVRAALAAQAGRVELAAAAVAVVDAVVLVADQVVVLEAVGARANGTISPLAS